MLADDEAGLRSNCGGLGDLVRQGCWLSVEAFAIHLVEPLAGRVLIDEDRRLESLILLVQ